MPLAVADDRSRWPISRHAISKLVSVPPAAGFRAGLIPSSVERILPRLQARRETRWRPRRRQREELQHRGGDDAERAFRADEEVLEVVAGIVLAELAQAVPDAAIGEDDLEAEAELAGIAIGDHRRAAGIGREIAADRAGTFRGEREREEPVRGLGRLLRLLQDDAGLDGHGVAGGIDRADLVEPLQRQDDLPAFGDRDLAADHAGIAALRHHRRAGLARPFHHGRHLGDRARPHHGLRLAVEEAARLLEIGHHRVGIGDDVLGADDAGQSFDNGRAHPASGAINYLQPPAALRKTPTSSIWAE
jgi:hypothetical protein